MSDSGQDFCLDYAGYGQDSSGQECRGVQVCDSGQAAEWTMLDG